MEGIETWEVRAFGGTMRWTGHMVRERLQRGELLGDERARPVGASMWAPLVEVSLYSDVFPEGSPRGRALRAALLTWSWMTLAACALIAWMGGTVWVMAVVMTVGQAPRLWRAWRLPASLPDPAAGDRQALEVELNALAASVSPTKLRDLERLRERAEGPLAAALDARLAASREAAAVAAELEAAQAALAHVEAATALREAVREGRARVADTVARLRAVAEVG